MSEKAADIRRFLIWVQMKKLTEMRALLEIVDSAKDIAKAQGSAWGYRDTIVALCDSFSIKVPNLDTPVTPQAEDKDVYDFREWDITKLNSYAAAADQLEESRDYKTFIQWSATRIEERKEYLFYSAEKGSDLHKTHGYRDAVNQVSMSMYKLRGELEKRIDENPLFEGRME